MFSLLSDNKTSEVKFQGTRLFIILDLTKSGQNDCQKTALSLELSNLHLALKVILQVSVTLTFQEINQINI